MYVPPTYLLIMFVSVVLKRGQVREQHFSKMPIWLTLRQSSVVIWDRKENSQSPPKNRSDGDWSQWLVLLWEIKRDEEGINMGLSENRVYSQL